MRAWNELTRNGQVARLRPLARQASSWYALAPRRLRVLSHGENTTWRLDADEGRFVVRVHREGYQTRETIESELLWLDALNRDGVRAPVALAARDGSRVQAVGGRLCVVFRWIDGRFATDRTVDRAFRRIGALLATLHAHAAAWRRPEGFTRQIWDADGLLGRNWTDPLAVPGLEDHERDVLAEARRRCRAAIAREDRSRFGLIHADLHRWNVLWRRGEPRPIDFDDSGFGYHLHDLVIVRRSIGSGAQQERRWDSVLEGYASVGVPPDLRNLPYFEVASALCALGWIHSRSDNPGLRRHVAGVRERVVARAEEFLASV